MTKLFAVKIGDKIGSFAPIELKEQTKKEIEALLNFDHTKLDDEKRIEILQLKEELLKATFIEGELINIKGEVIDINLVDTTKE